MGQNSKEQYLDVEWLQLIQDALETGITVEEIRAFLGNPIFWR